jgi:tetratricopeptide (TPR) repeat protein
VRDEQAARRAAYAQAQSDIRVGRAEAAERVLRTLQGAAPGEVNSLRLLGVALLAQGKLEAAQEALQSVVRQAPDFLQARIDLARVRRLQGRLEEARCELHAVLHLANHQDDAWLAYGDVLSDLRRYPLARFAFEQARLHDQHRLEVERASEALARNDLQFADATFRKILQWDASHVWALCGLAAVALGMGNHRDSERLLRHAQQRTPHCPVMRRGLAHTLVAAGRLPEAETILRALVEFEPENAQNWAALGGVYSRLLRQTEALAAFEAAARLNPGQVALRHSIGHLHKTLGNRADCERAYRECLELDPTFGEAWWSLADLKNYTFSDSELSAMRELVNTTAGTAQVHFALGRALEQRAEYAEAFAHYEHGNGLRRSSSPFDIERFEAKSQRTVACFDQVFLARQVGAGCPDASPIFVVGLPRSGSTLVEQILASHSKVEGTMELPNILALVNELEHATGHDDEYPECLRAASPGLLERLGRRYIEETRAVRLGRPRFIDKMPNNFSHLGLIHAILPNATIIDVRRHPMDACFSAYKQHFAQGQSFSYDLRDLGRYYRAYLEVMDHWDAVLPGKVMHLQYEDLVRDPRRVIDALLRHCGLAFEPACLSAHKTSRPVRTASAEQVRQPLYSSGIGYWKHFTQQLEPLRQSLGDCLERFT